VAQDKLLSYHLPGVKICHAPEVADMCLNFISTIAIHPACQLYNMGLSNPKKMVAGHD
jgi:hypothetical protein